MSALFYAFGCGRAALIKEKYMPTTLFSEIEYLKGVGKARGEKYRKLGITSPYELIYHIPRSYLDFRTHVPVAQDRKSVV